MGEKIVIVGAVAAGPKAACRARQLIRVRHFSSIQTLNSIFIKEN
jgi:hypothetical protein